MNQIGTASRGIQLPLTERLAGKQGVSGSDLPSSFQELLSSGIAQVNETQKGADAQVHELLTGGDVSKVEVLTAVQKADMAFRLLVQIRNKLMAAYEELNAIRI